MEAVRWIADGILVAGFAKGDIATLYELWCYFKVVEGVRELLGPPEVAEVPEVKWRGEHVRQGFRVRWKDATVYYNPTFTPGPRGFVSQSFEYRPDILLRCGGALHVLDAKFKVRPTSGDDEKLTWVKGDIEKMHVYRDALVGVESAQVLYPGDVRKEFGPVGAVPLRPGDVARLAGVLSELLVRAMRRQEQCTRSTVMSPTGRE